MEQDEGLLTPEYLVKELCKVLALRYGYADGYTMDWIQKNLFQPLLAKDNRRIEELFKEIEDSGLLPHIHDYEYYIDEAGKQQSKHKPNCRLCKWQSLKDKYLGGSK